MEQVEKEARDLQLAGPRQRISSAYDAIDALLAVADKETWLVEVLEGRIRSLQELRWRGESEQLRGEVQAYERMLGRATATLSSIVRLSLETVRVRLEQDEIALFRRALNVALRSGGLEGMALERARGEFARVLRLDAEQRRAMEQQPELEGLSELPPGQS